MPSSRKGSNSAVMTNAGGRPSSLPRKGEARGSLRLAGGQWRTLLERSPRHSCGFWCVLYMFSKRIVGSNPSAEPSMDDQIVITEKSSQARDVRGVVGLRFGDILPAEGHLIDLLEPEDVVPEWKMVGAIDAVCDVAQRIIGKLTQGPVAGGPPLVNSSMIGSSRWEKYTLDQKGC
jgi:hypothetical protein